MKHLNNGMEQDAGNSTLQSKLISACTIHRMRENTVTKSLWCALDWHFSSTVAKTMFSCLVAKGITFQDYKTSSTWWKLSATKWMRINCSNQNWCLTARVHITTIQTNQYHTHCYPSLSKHELQTVIAWRLTAKRNSRHDFPTPESPIRRSLNR